MAKRVPKPTGLKGWQRLGSGHKGREQMPKHVFYDPARRRFPHKVYRGGEWVESPRMQMAARIRAGQQRNATVFAKASKDINVRRRKQGKEPFKTTISRKK